MNQSRKPTDHRSEKRSRPRVSPSQSHPVSPLSRKPRRSFSSHSSNASSLPTQGSHQPLAISLPFPTCSYIYTHSKSPTPSFPELGAAVERTLIARTSRTPVLLTGKEASPHSLGHAFPGVETKIPVLAVQVGWGDIVRAAAPKEGPGEGGPSTGMKLCGHVALLDAAELRRYLGQHVGKTILRIFGDRIIFRSGARLARRQEVVCLFEPNQTRRADSGFEERSDSFRSRRGKTKEG